MKIWSKPHFENYTANAKLLFLYLILNEHRNESALYSLSYNRISSDISLTTEQIETAMQSLIDSGKVVYDKERAVVWVKNAVKHQALNENCIKSINNDLKHCSSSKMVAEFLEYYAYLNCFVTPINGFTNPSIGIGYREQGIGTGIVKKSEVSEDDFEKIWSLYPNRQGKKSASRYFFATVKTIADLDRIRNALSNYLQSGNVKNGFIKNGSTWFNDWESWENPTQEMMKGNSNGATKSNNGQPKRKYAFDKSKYPTSDTWGKTDIKP